MSDVVSKVAAFIKQCNGQGKYALADSILRAHLLVRNGNLCEEDQNAIRLLIAEVMRVR